MTFVQPGPIRDDYAGPGGWSDGLARLGLTDVGIEWDADACATRIAAGHATIRADLATYRTDTPLWGYIASPPCQSFSAAGSGEGRALIATLVKIVHDGDWTQAEQLDPRTRHVIDVARNCDELDTEWICLEQVPPVLPIWHAIAHRLRARGYSVWCGVLNSANFGVPQTRKRAVLIASRARTVTAPPPTHAKTPSHDLFSEPLHEWISMAAALGWNGWVDRRQGHTDEDGVRTPVPVVTTDQPAPSLTVQAGAASQWLVQRVGFPRVDDTGDSEDGYRDRDWMDPLEPAGAVTAKARSWRVEGIMETPVVLRSRRDSPAWIEGHGSREDTPVDRPAPTLTGEAHRWAWDDAVVATGQQSSRIDRDPAHAELYERPLDEPAPTVTGSADQWSVGAPGHRVVLNPGATKSQPNRRTYEVDEPAPTLAFGHDAGSWCWENPAPTVTGGRDGAAIGGSRIRNKVGDSMAHVVPEDRWVRGQADDPEWPASRPATTIAGDPRVPQPGHKNDKASPDSPGRMEGSIRLEVPEALVLQSFARDRVVIGSRTSQFQQIGNAIPPLLAMHCAAMATGIPPAII